MLCLQSGLDQFLTVEMLDLYCVPEANLVPGVGSLVLASTRLAFASGTPDTP